MHERESIACPAHAPLTARPDWRVDGTKPGADLDLLRRQPQRRGFFFDNARALYRRDEPVF